MYQARDSWPRRYAQSGKDLGPCYVPGPGGDTCWLVCSEPEPPMRQIRPFQFQPQNHHHETSNHPISAPSIRQNPPQHRRCPPSFCSAPPWLLPVGRPSPLCSVADWLPLLCAVSFFFLGSEGGEEEEGRRRERDWDVNWEDLTSSRDFGEEGWSIELCFEDGNLN